MRLDHLRAINTARMERRAIALVSDLEDGTGRLFAATDPLEGALGAALRAAFLSGKSGAVDVEGRSLFLHIHVPPPRIVAIGAVRVSQSLAAMAKLAGFDLTVIDPRAPCTAPECFANVDLISDLPSAALSQRPLDAYTALVAVSHDPALDDAPVIEALQAGCFYVGALGSRKTHAKRLDRLRAEGLAEVDLARISGPIGLDIGAVTPAEIAVSILAEVIQTWRRRSLEPAPSREDAVGIVLLAAGRASRMGSGGPHKLLAEFSGTPLVRRMAQTALAAAAAQLVVVTGHRAQEIEETLAGLDLQIVRNPAFAEGMASSLVAGVLAKGMAQREGMLVLLADMPGITTADLMALIAAFRTAGGRAIVRAVSNGKRGNPVILPRAAFPEILKLQGDVGARNIIETGGFPIVDVEIGPAAHLDIDTPDAVIAAGGVLKG